MLKFTALAVVLFSLTYCGEVIGHEAPTGWNYPNQCCSGIDCRPVPEEAIGTSRVGYVIRQTGEVIGFRDTRLKPSPDGTFHWCSERGREDTKTVCLFVPPLGY